MKETVVLIFISYSMFEVDVKIKKKLSELKKDITK